MKFLQNRGFASRLLRAIVKFYNRLCRKSLERQVGEETVQFMFCQYCCVINDVGLLSDTKQNEFSGLRNGYNSENCNQFFFNFSFIPIYRFVGKTKFKYICTNSV